MNLIRNDKWGRYLQPWPEGQTLTFDVEPVPLWSFIRYFFMIQGMWSCKTKCQMLLSWFLSNLFSGGISPVAPPVDTGGAIIINNHKKNVSCGWIWRVWNDVFWLKWMERAVFFKNKIIPSLIVNEFGIKSEKHFPILLKKE